MNPKNLSNEELLVEYRELNAAAFDEFYRRNAPLVYNFLMARLRNQAAADDVLQETFIRVHRHVNRFDPKKNALNWLFTIAKNCALDWLAQLNRAHRPDSTQTADQVVDPNLGALAARDLETLLQDLSPDDRQLILDRFVRDEDYETLAKARKITPAGARQRVSRLMNRLRHKAQTLK